MHPDRLDATFNIPKPAPKIEKVIAIVIPNESQKLGFMQENTCFHPVYVIFAAEPSIGQYLMRVSISLLIYLKLYYNF